MAEENSITMVKGKEPENPKTVKFPDALDGEREEKVVMGLKYLMALSDALICIEHAKATVPIAQDTIKDLASLIGDKAEQVWDALESKNVI
jgi:hypothetical protein